MVSIVPLLGTILGALNGWIAGRSLESIIVGAIVGSLTFFTSLLGFIPVAGVVIYHFVERKIFNVVKMDLCLVYWYGFILAVLWTAATVLIILKMLFDIY